MPRSTIAAVGSNARCGSAVLISNERSMTRGAVGADDAFVAPDATAAEATTARAPNAALAPERVRKRSMRPPENEGSEVCELSPPRAQVVAVEPVRRDESEARRPPA